MDKHTVFENGYSLTIRPMTADDLPGVLRVERACFSLPWTEKSFLDALGMECYHFLTASSENEIVGYCGSIRSFETADIANIAVLEGCRRSGIGEMLLRQVMEDGFRDGVERFSLEVRASNASAIALYKKLGFRQEGLRKGYYEAPREDALIMWTPPRESGQPSALW